MTSRKSGCILVTYSESNIPLSCFVFFCARYCARDTHEGLKQAKEKKNAHKPSILFFVVCLSIVNPSSLIEIHLQEDADSEPICPLSEKNVNTLVQELELTTQERAEVEAIQTKEELATYFEKIPRDYDVQIIVSEAHGPDCKRISTGLLNIFTVVLTA